MKMMRASYVFSSLSSIPPTTFGYERLAGLAVLRCRGAGLQEGDVVSERIVEACKSRKAAGRDIQADALPRPDTDEV